MGVGGNWREEGVAGSWREEGVAGRVCEDGVDGNKIEFLLGVLTRLDGVIGNGIANSRNFLVVGFALGVGDEGVARMERADGDFGEADARRRV